MAVNQICTDSLFKTSILWCENLHTYEMNLHREVENSI